MSDEDGALALWRCDRTLASESLSRRSEAMRKMAGPPVARLSTADARRLAIGSTVALEWRSETIEVAVRADEAVAEGVLILARDARWNSPPPPGARVRVRAPVAVTNGDRP